MMKLHSKNVGSSSEVLKAALTKLETPSANGASPAEVTPSGTSERPVDPRRQELLAIVRSALENAGFPPSMSGLIADYLRSAQGGDFQLLRANIQRGLELLRSDIPNEAQVRVGARALVVALGERPLDGWSTTTLASAVASLIGSSQRDLGTALLLNAAVEAGGGAALRRMEQALGPMGDTRLPFPPPKGGAEAALAQLELLQGGHPSGPGATARELLSERMPGPLAEAVVGALEHLPIASREGAVADVVEACETLPGRQAGNLTEPLTDVLRSLCGLCAEAPFDRHEARATVEALGLISGIPEKKLRSDLAKIGLRVISGSSAKFSARLQLFFAAADIKLPPKELARAREKGFEAQIREAGAWYNYRAILQAAAGSINPERVDAYLLTSFMAAVEHRGPDSAELPELRSLASKPLQPSSSELRRRMTRCLELRARRSSDTMPLRYQYDPLVAQVLSPADELAAAKEAACTVRYLRDPEVLAKITRRFPEITADDLRRSFPVNDIDVFAVLSDIPGGAGAIQKLRDDFKGYLIQSSVLEFLDLVLPEAVPAVKAALAGEAAQAS